MSECAPPAPKQSRKFSLTSPNASATIAISGADISVLLTNNIQNPTASVDILTAFSFTLSDAPGLNFLESGGGPLVTVNSDGTYIVPFSDATRWNLSSFGNKLTLSNGQLGPEPGIIGFSDAGNYTSGAYSAANFTVTDSSPFLESGTTFILVAAGVTASTTVAEATFYFGSKNITSMGEIMVNPTSVPDNGPTVALLGLGVTVLAVAHLMKKGVGLSISPLAVAG